MIGYEYFIAFSVGFSLGMVCVFVLYKKVSEVLLELDKKYATMINMLSLWQTKI